MSYDANTAFARCLVDEWRRGGVTDGVLSPGSRSAPLALALAEHGQMAVHVHLDERSASFFALGLAKASGRPAVLLCTSGTAAANFHPAVLEASHGRVPMIVCTADRPPELREVGEAQTIDQTRLYGTAVRWYAEAEAPSRQRGEAAEVAIWRSLAARALAEALGPPAGPVHLNLPFREPLVPSGPARPPFDLGGRPGTKPFVHRPGASHLADGETVDDLTRRVAGTRRGALVAGWGLSPVAADAVERLAKAAGWPILADPLSGLRRGPLAVSTYDALSRIEAVRDELQPDLVIRVGAPLTSRQAMTWLARSPTVTVDPQRSWSDPARASDLMPEVEPGPLLDAVAGRLAPAGTAPGPTAWLSRWMQAERAARDAIDAALDAWAEPFEGRVARDLMACLPDGTGLAVASSMPVRDLETFAAGRNGVTVVANRGVNGIDGFVSTVLGMAASRTWPVTVALLGDLCLLHDANGLLGANGRGLDAVLVVLDNHGGGIFSFLPQARLPAHFEELFGTPQEVDLRALCALHGVPVTEVDRADALATAVGDAIAGGGV
ncbi:MAG: 2-succinyl-5-enolpyruvyl-6-hydroxy-3-cyclohexene-1-carboxylic-acid synthase, partial [Acidimicrobiales bacterium]|nr:2-succinyl-5-enolpyruvyl-6-hydroxy-3-cyclohexene-1-carboxylic-acid synthase [Acidimicrobiales bacterium]